MFRFRSNIFKRRKKELVEGKQVISRAKVFQSEEKLKSYLFKELGHIVSVRDVSMFGGGFIVDLLQYGGIPGFEITISHSGKVNFFGAFSNNYNLDYKAVLNDVRRAIQKLNH